MTEDFIPPPDDEPIPQPPPGGSTDAGLGGVEVSPEEMDEAEKAFIAELLGLPASAVAGAPTWAAVYKLATSHLGTYPPQRQRENVNMFTYWFYGTWNIAAAWCFIFISWCLAHSGASQAAGLSLIGGKRAWVPDILKVGGARSGSSGMKPGAIVAINGFSHIGFCTYVSGSTFHLLSGNSVKGSSTDGITVKSYDTGIVSGHANLAYATTPTPTPTPPPKPQVDEAEYDEWVA